MSNGIFKFVQINMKHLLYINITFPAQVIVENIIPRNVIITLAGNVIFTLLY